MFLKDIGTGKFFTVPGLGDRNGTVIHQGESATSVLYHGFDTFETSKWDDDEGKWVYAQVQRPHKVVQISNLTEVQEMAGSAGIEVATGKRKRGRPKGSKNKSKRE